MNQMIEIKGAARSYWDDPEILTKNFLLFDNYLQEFPNQTVIPITGISNEALELIFAFIRRLQVPTSESDWIKLVLAAEYLQLDDKYSQHLKHGLLEFLHENGFKYDPDLSLQVLAKKLQDPNYISPDELHADIETYVTKNI